MSRKLGFYVEPRKRFPYKLLLKIALNCIPSAATNLVRNYQ